VVFSLGSHTSRETAQVEWEGIVARRESPAEYRRRRDGHIPSQSRRGSA